MTTFRAWPVRDGLHVDVPTSPAGPVQLRSWHADGAGMNYTGTVPRGGCAIILPTEKTLVMWRGVEMALNVRCYAQVPGGARMFGGAGLMIYTPQYAGLAQAGGPAEDAGRLTYLDGCSDSLLVCPATLGDPCLNLLHFPAGVAQIEHSHTSERVGLVLAGAGVCRTADGDARLTPDMFWHVPAGLAHSFHTVDSGLDVFVWHPDSVFGPSHEARPMLARTLVDGAPV